MRAKRRVLVDVFKGANGMCSLINEGMVEWATRR